ncbi:MAG: hypothetical protein IPJ65_18070 [Archangiaceae bacterium]|nr:hypothetical protein [Archangiaceae bacterium]
MTTSKSISMSRLTAFAPPALATALREETKTAFTVADVKALAARYHDSEDFEGARYLDQVLANLGGAAPVQVVTPRRDPITYEAELAASVAKRARAIAEATGMPEAHAVLFAKADYTVEQGKRAWELELPGGQAFMYAKLGATPDQALALGKAKVDKMTSYELLSAKAPPELIPQIIDAGISAPDLKRYFEKGFSAADAITLKQLEVSAYDAPDFLTVDQIKTVRETEHPFQTFYTLTRHGFSFEEAVALLDRMPRVDIYIASDLKELGKFSFEQIVNFMESPTVKGNRKQFVALVAAGFDRKQLDACERFRFNDFVTKDAINSGYSTDELVQLWSQDLGLNGRMGSQSMPRMHAAGFTVAQVLEAREVGLDDYSVEKFQAYGFSPEEMLTLARAGYGSDSKLKDGYLSLGIEPRDAYDLIIASK